MFRGGGFQKVAVVYAFFVQNTKVFCNAPYTTTLFRGNT